MAAMENSKDCLSSRDRGGHVVGLEVPVPITYVASDGFAHPVGTERADLTVDLQYVIELKVGPANGSFQATRYAATLKLVPLVVNIKRTGDFTVCAI